jgi:hypothetical protein
VNPAGGESAVLGRSLSNPFRSQFATFATLTWSHYLINTRVSATERGSCVTGQGLLSLARP